MHIYSITNKSPTSTISYLYNNTTYFIFYKNPQVVLTGNSACSWPLFFLGHLKSLALFTFDLFSLFRDLFLSVAGVSILSFESFLYFNFHAVKTSWSIYTQHATHYQNIPITPTFTYNTLTHTAHSGYIQTHTPSCHTTLSKLPSPLLA